MANHKKEIKVYIYLLILSIIVIFIAKMTDLNICSTKERFSGEIIDTTAGGFDFDKDVLKLDSGWKIYFGDFLTSDELSKQKDLLYSELNSWNKLGYPSTGKATYYTIIKKPQTINSFAIKITNAYTNYSLFVNGKKVNGLSDSQANPNKSVSITSDYHFFDVEGDTIEVLIHVENTDFFIGGLNASPVLGIPKNIQLIKDTSLAVSVFLVSVLTCISLFIFSFYIAKNDENNIIYLGLASIFYVIKVLLSTNSSLYFLYYSVPLSILFKISLISGMFTIYFTLEYFKNSFVRDKKYIPNIIKAAMLIYVIFVIFSKPSFLYIVSAMTIILIAASYTYIFALTIKDLKEHRQKAIFNFSGAIVLILSFLIDINNLDVSRYQIIGLFIFCVLALVNIINDYVITYENLRQIKSSLETEVENRTLELVTIHNNLEREMRARIVAEENLRSIPNYDFTTGLFNIMYASNYLDAQISAFYRHKQIFSIIICEIDDMKNIANAFNKNLTERILLESSEIIRQCLRKTDILSRWKNDRFIIIMANCSEHSAISVAEKVQISISQNIIEGIGSITVSLGVSTVRDNDNSNLITKRAEKNLETSRSKKRL